jgi:hypothetical protein
MAPIDPTVQLDRRSGQTGGDEAFVVTFADLNCLVCVGALGLDHITAAEFATLWDAFAPGAIFAITVHEELAHAGERLTRHASSFRGGNA